jgi:hypothetical protein
MVLIDQKNCNKKLEHLTSWFVAIFAIKILIIFFISYPLINHHTYNIYQQIVGQSLIPYKDFYFEYPPLFALINSVPFNFIKFKNHQEYLVYFQFFTLIFDLLAMQISLKILTKLNNEKLEIIKQKKFYLTWIISSTILSFFIYQCLEYVIIFIFMLNILFFNISDNKYNFKFYLLSIIGIWTKIISSLNLPLAIIFHSYKKSINLSEFIFLTFRNGLFLALTIILTLLIFEYFFDFKMLKNLSSQYFREIDMFSIAGNYIFITDKILDIKSEIYVLMSPSIHPNIYTNIFLTKHLFKIIYFLFMFSTFVILAIGKKNNKEILIDLLLFLEGSATIILIFLSFHNVLSPQFIGYLVPIISILAIHYKSKKLLFFSLIIFTLTTILLPIMLSLKNGELLSILILTVRNLTILFTCFYFIAKFYQKLLKPLII